ncbi:MAG TPA: hypothetical protein VI072_09315 [Polyangiaceae bacterium]
MHRNVLLVPLLALWMSSACGGKGEQPSGGVADLSSLEDQSPPPADQQPDVSDDQPRVSDRLPATTAGETCESLCGFGGPDCDPRGCVESCNERPSAYAACLDEWQTLLVCAAVNQLFCGREDIGAAALYEVCQPEYVALLRCANLL